MVKFIKQILIFCLAFIVIANVISWLSLKALQSASFYKPNFMVNTITPSNYNYIILGASTGLTTLNTKVIDSVCGSKGVNLSMDDTKIASQYVMLQHFLEQGNTTKVCVLVPSNLSYDANDKSLSDNDYRFLMYVNTPYVYNYYSKFSGIRSKILKWSKYFPMLGVGYYNAELFYPSILSVLKPQYRNRFDNKGNYTYPKINTTDKLITNKHKHTLNFTNPYLANIKTLCEAHNISLIYYLSPTQKQSIQSKTTAVPIINHSDSIMNAKLFYDAIHVNTLGRQKASVMFAKQIQPYIVTNNE